MAKKKEQLEVLTNQTVTRKTSWVVWVKRTYLMLAILWAVVFIGGPYYIMKTYSTPIKQSMVVAMFFDLQKSIAHQYQNLLESAKKNIDLSKPIAIATEKVKLAEKQVANVDKVTKDAKTISGLAGKFGVNTSGADKVLTTATDTTATVNKQIDKIQNELVKASQAEIDKMIDAEIKKIADKNLGGLGTTLLTDYKIKTVRPWLPSSWPTATKIYRDLEKSSASTIAIIMNTVNTYFSYVAWGMVIFCWVIFGLLPIVWGYLQMKKLTKPFVVCPRCGHAFMDKRTGWFILKIVAPWTWF